jgi:hypothetical protein
MSENRRRAFKPLRLFLSQIEDVDARTSLEMRFDEVQVRREVAVESARKSAIADRERQIATAQAEIDFIRLMQEAAKHLPEIAREPVWAAFRDKGQVVFECPFSENDMRNAMKVQRAEMEQRAQQLGENDEDVYRGGEEPQEPEE